LSFFILFSYFIQWVWWTSNTHLNLVRAIVDENRFEIDSFYNNTGDRSYYNGHYYSDKLPGLSFLSTPIYFLWKHISNSLCLEKIGESYFTTHVYNSQYGSTVLVKEIYTNLSTSILKIILIIFTSSLFSSLTTIILYRLLSLFFKNKKLVLLTVIVYALGTLTWSYSTVYYYHATQTFLLFFSFYLLYKFFSSKEKKYFILSGILAGFSSVTSITSSFIVGVFFLYQVCKKKKK